jgi:hypothetical protein
LIIFNKKRLPLRRQKELFERRGADNLTARKPIANIKVLLLTLINQVNLKN